MELRHLRYFVVTAEELHFTKAARRLGISQPPLTYQIKSLEEEIGVKLFDRQPGNVRLTEPGEVLLGECRVILERVAKATERCRLAAAGRIGRLSVGFTESASFTGEVTWVLQKFRELYPEVELTLEEHRTEPLMERLRHRQLDVAFVRLPIGRDSDMEFKLVSTEPMVVALPKSHHLANREILELTQLRDEPFVLYPRPTRMGLTDQVITACEREGFSPRVVQNVPQISSTINLVAASLGITIVPACMSTSRVDQVRYIPIRGAELLASLGVAWREDAATTALRNLLALVEESKSNVLR